MLVRQPWSSSVWLINMNIFTVQYIQSRATPPPPRHHHHHHHHTHTPPPPHPTAPPPMAMFNGLGKDNCNTRRVRFKFWDLVRLIFIFTVWRHTSKKSTIAIGTELLAKWGVAVATSVTTIKHKICKWIYMSKCYYRQPTYGLNMR